MRLENETRDKLIEMAKYVRQWAYAPYSKYPVGAAVLMASGKMYDGVNIENAAYPDGICAERTAIFKAISEGERELLAVAVVTENGGSPCGSCRQVLSEFGLGADVYICNTQGEIVMETTVSGLLPGAFTPQHLPGLH
ncbi:MAG: cytidine deaminase [Anaerolineae bacterium]|nr:cytidine deaminase [Anaerolineae bacterium]